MAIFNIYTEHWGPQRSQRKPVEITAVVFWSSIRRDNKNLETTELEVRRQLL